MVMMEVLSIQEIEQFPKNKWGIPEPPEDLLLQRANGADMGVIDLVILPGVAFDSLCGRVGHGKGYYDSFLERVNAGNAAHNRPPPTTIAISFDEQVVESVPMAAHDKYLDFVVTPTRTFVRGA